MVLNAASLGVEIDAVVVRVPSQVSSPCIWGATARGGVTFMRSLFLMPSTCFITCLLFV